MRKLATTLSIIFALIILQIAVYSLFLKQPTSTWGASSHESQASMPGDNLSAEFQSTRAITINAPLNTTWNWLNQLGADRSGFFSYYFIEQFLGYQTRPHNIVEAIFPQLLPGDLIRGSITPSKSIIVYEFPVIETKTNSYIVVQNWGVFLLKPINSLQTRLIIRTHRPNSNNFLKNSFDYFIGEGMHFLMERATLTGFKARVETGSGPAFSDAKDKLWFFGIIGSALSMIILIFLLRGIGAIILPTLLSTVWTFVLLALEPIPLYSTLLLIVVIGLIAFTIFNRSWSASQHKRD